MVVVLPPDAVPAWSGTTGERAVAGGATRSESVRAGLAAVPDDAAVVCVHDAARPLATAATVRRVIAAVRAGADGAVPAVPVTDTIKVVDADGVVRRPPTGRRSSAVQTPQAFRADVLRAAHAAEPEGTDDASLVERHGGRVVTVAGEAGNRKITTPDDLEWAHAQARPRQRVPSIEVRVGNGFDVHRSGDDPRRPLVLGGCAFPGLPGLVGHSDGDAVAHAVADALLGAAGLGDLGQHFPDTDPAWAGADSIELLRRWSAACAPRAGRSATPTARSSASCPSWRRGVTRCSAASATCSARPVSVKGRRPEGLGALGRGEGIVCLASVVLTRPARPGRR